MTYLDSLAQTVQSSIAENHVGIPVFVRCIANLADCVDDILLRLDQLTTATNTWLDATPSRVYASGATGLGQVSVMLEYASGASALVCVALASGEPHIHLTVIGNHGTLYHSDPVPASSNERGQFSPSTEAGVLRLAIGESLRSGEPKTVNY